MRGKSIILILVACLIIVLVSIQFCKCFDNRARAEVEVKFPRDHDTEKCKVVGWKWWRSSYRTTKITVRLTCDVIVDWGTGTGYASAKAEVYAYCDSEKSYVLKGRLSCESDETVEKTFEDPVTRESVENRIPNFKVCYRLYAYVMRAFDFFLSQLFNDNYFFNQYLIFLTN